jgi:hypothetical protein
MVGEAELDLEPRGETEFVGEEEEVFDDVPEGEDVLVEVIVFVEVLVPVWVREPWDEVVGREESVDVFEMAAVFVASGVNKGVLVCIRERVDCREGKDVFVEVVVLVDVFDSVDEEVSITPLKRRFLCPPTAGKGWDSTWPCPSIGPHPMKKRTRNTRFILLCLTIILDLSYTDLNPPRRISSIA